MFDQKVLDTVETLNTTDDMYNCCTKYVEESKQLTGLDWYKQQVEYCEVHYLFRKKQYEGSGVTHGLFFDAYYEPMTDAFHRLLQARDNLMDFCEKNHISAV